MIYSSHPQDEHENFLQNLTRMVELERERVDEVYRGHEPAVNLNQQLHKEIGKIVYHCINSI
jgi:hypothetical protein